MPTDFNRFNMGENIEEPFDSVGEPGPMVLPDVPIESEPQAAPAPAPAPMGVPAFDPQKLEEESAAFRRRQAILGGVGGAIDSLLNAPSAASIRLGIQQPKSNVGASFNQIAAAQQDPWSKQKQIYEQYKMAKGVKDAQREDDFRKREDSLDSNESSMARALAAKVMPGKDFSQMNATEITRLMPWISKIYSAENERLYRDAVIGQHKNEAAAKKEEKEQALNTPYGTANSLDDAKQLKEAHESKKNFDNKIEEMIALREKHGGGAVWNREDVERGKQLSKDLLLEYKNMAKLGVLSQSDEKIINAIIPEDPLAFNSPIAAIQGQDPILHRLKSFKSDSDKDFATRISTRTRGGGRPPKVVVKTQTNPRTGQRRVVYSDGSTEVVDSKVAGGANGG